MSTASYGLCQIIMPMQAHLLQTETIHLRTALTKMRAEAMTYQQDIKKLQVVCPCITPRSTLAGYKV